jgi:hypothetical protein
VPALETIFQYLSDFNAYRDDSHMAAFQSHQIEAYAWEAFSLVWSGAANTAENVYDQLVHRGYSRTEYVGALKQLTQRDWVETSGDFQYRVTEVGNTVREAAEHLTDEYFYAPWKVLNVDEAQEIKMRLITLEDKLNAISE